MRCFYKLISVFIKRIRSEPVFKSPEHGLHLLKLHGSIDWRRVGEQTSATQMPTVKIHQLEPEDVKRPELRPAVIFGNRNKLTAEGPFLDLLRAFQDELAESAIEALRDPAQSKSLVGFREEKRVLVYFLKSQKKAKASARR